jgi:hypothetical protein
LQSFGGPSKTVGAQFAVLNQWFKGQAPRTWPTQMAIPLQMECESFLKTVDRCNVACPKAQSLRHIEKE